MVMGISMTAPGTIRYPQHRHSFCEIMYYTEGVGFLEAGHARYPFSPGTAIIVPPNMLHGSVSESGFQNISIGGHFDTLIMGDTPLLIPAEASADAGILSRLIYKNRSNRTEYIHTLADCYVLSLMQAHSAESPIAAAVKKIVNTISDRADDPEWHIADALNLSGYAEDYIRAKFKEICKETPTEMLNRLRIQNACRIMEIYSRHLNITEIAEKVGFSSPAYFSRVFKKVMGLSPRQYMLRFNDR